MTEREQQLLTALRSAVPVEREEAARAIRDERCRAAAVLDALGAAALSDPDPTVRYFAVQTRGLALDVLAAVLDRDTAQSVRREAAASLFFEATESSLARRCLIEALHDVDYDVRARALSYLHDHPEVIANGNVVPLLIVLLDDADQAIRADAARALGSAKAVAVDALPRLGAILNEAHVERELRAEVTRAIQRIDASARAKASKPSR
jgi:hypothetical protein